MNRKYHKYTDWEDYKNGMYSAHKYDESETISLCVKLFNDFDLFEEYCNKVIELWPVSSSENLTNINLNRKAWIGQACCSFALKSTELTTKKAWKILSCTTQNKCNIIAENTIKKYERKHKSIHKKMGTKMLF